jgi:ribokinase
MSGVVVVGSLNMDVTARVAHLPAIGETVLGTSVSFSPGGKGANQAVAAARLGAATTMVGRVGTDAFGDSLLEFLAAQGVGVTGVRRTADAASGTALIVVGNGSENSIVVVPGANAAVEVADLDRAGASPGPGDVVVAQYEIPLPVVLAALSRARDAGALTILNPAPALAGSGDVLALADVVVVNEAELQFLVSAPRAPAAAEEALGLARRLQRRPDQAVIATLGPLGAVAVVGSGAVAVDGHQVEAVDSTGAGDCFVGALAASLGRGTDMAEAVRFANMAASISVQHPGAGPSMPSLADVNAAMGPR